MQANKNSDNYDDNRKPPPPPKEEEETIPKIIENGNRSGTDL